MWYVLHLNPEPWAVGPVGVARTSGKMRPFVGRNQQLAAYQEAVREAMPEHAQEIVGPVSLSFFFWRHMAEYVTPQARTHRKHEADATNMQKALEDALQGVLYKNDRDVKHIESYIVDQGPEVIPLVIVEAKPYTGDPLDDIPDSLLNDVLHADEILSLFEDTGQALRTDTEGLF